MEVSDLPVQTMRALRAMARADRVLARTLPMAYPEWSDAVIGPLRCLRAARALRKAYPRKEVK